MGRVEANRIRISDERVESDRILRDTESNRIVPNQNFSIRFELWCIEFNSLLFMMFIGVESVLGYSSSFI